jgi:hypothetical protein
MRRADQAGCGRAQSMATYGDDQIPHWLRHATFIEPFLILAALAGRGCRSRPTIGLYREQTPMCLFGAHDGAVRRVAVVPQAVSAVFQGRSANVAAFPTPNEHSAFSKLLFHARSPKPTVDRDFVTTVLPQMAPVRGSVGTRHRQ